LLNCKFEIFVRDGTEGEPWANSSRVLSPVGWTSMGWFGHHPRGWRYATVDEATKESMPHTTVTTVSAGRVIRARYRG